MVEAGANEIPEAEILDALDIAHAEIKKLCALQRELRREGRQGEDSRSRSRRSTRSCSSEIKASHGAALDEATQVEDKLERQDATKAVEAAVLEQYAPAAPEGADARSTLSAARRAVAARLRQAREGDHPRAHRRRTRSAPTAARRTRSATSRSRSASRRARTARRCSRAARRRR